MKIDIPLKSDDEGMIGRECPDEDCRKYFKVVSSEYTSFSKNTLFCPYCGINAQLDQFHTKDQIKYAQSIAIRKLLPDLQKKLKKLERRPLGGSMFQIGIKVDFEEPTIQHYFEKVSRKNIKCDKCGNTFSVFGLSFFCPYCGPRAPIDIFRVNADSIRDIIGFEEQLSKDRDLIRSEIVRELHEAGTFDEIIMKMLDKAVTGFEAYCKNKYAKKMTKKHPGSSEEKWIKKAGNTFQNLDKAEKLLKQDLSYSLKTRLSSSDKKIIEMGFQKRHVIIHNNGVIDEAYVKKSGESSSLIGTRLRISKKEVDVLLQAFSELVEEIERTM